MNELRTRAASGQPGRAVRPPPPPERPPRAALRNFLSLCAPLKGTAARFERLAKVSFLFSASPAAPDPEGLILSPREAARQAIARSDRARLARDAAQRLIGLRSAPRR